MFRTIVSKKTRKYICFLFLGLSILTFIPLLIPDNDKYDFKAIGDEAYNPNLYFLNSINKVIHYSDSLYNEKHIGSLDTTVYVGIVSDLIKQRFRFGLSHYNLSENWIAYLSGKYLWFHLSAIVNPDDIIQRATGLCSQQTIVFMEVLKDKGINVRSIGLGKKEGPGHFLCEVHYNNSWRLHDVTKEPQWRKITKHHESINYYLNYKDSLFRVYEYRMPKKEFDIIIKQVSYGKVNDFPAKKMLLFHRVTRTATYIIPFIFLALFFTFSKKLD